MRIHRPLKHLAEKIATAVQSLRLLAVQLLAWWAEATGDRGARLHLQRELRLLRRHTRLVLCLGVAARMRFPERARETPRPFGSPGRYRYRHYRVRLARVLTRGLRLRTLDDMRAALDAYDATVARLLARVPKAFVGAGLVMRRLGVIADASICQLFDCAADAPDTS